MMKSRVRIWLKLLAVIVLTFLLIYMITEDRGQTIAEQPEGEQIRTEDVRILMEELSETSLGVISSEHISQILAQETTAFLHYDTYLKIIEAVLGEEAAFGDNGERNRKEREKERLREQILFLDRYKADYFLLKDDWYCCYQELLVYYGLDMLIREEIVELVCRDQSLVGDRRLSQDCMLDGAGKIWYCLSDELQDLSYTVVRAYVHDDKLLTLKQTLKDQACLANVWIMESGEQEFRFFFRGYEIQSSWQAVEERQIREQVGDILYGEGTLQQIKIKDQRVGGKLLSLSETQIEIEGKGSFPIRQDCTGYQLYENLRNAERDELAIGYDFADFVLEKGEVCVFLILRKEKMEYIRVAVKNNGFSDLYHQKIILKSQEGMLVSYGDYEQRLEETIAPGEELVLTDNSPYFEGSRIEIKPLVQSGKIQVSSLERSQGVPSYRGKVEVLLTEQGLVLINEVLLEEYLYSVVPSEMPASYPAEALKAQAICARTYAFRYLQQPGYGALGAHVDDSVSYQVYNNIAENVESTKAVKETAGMLLLYEGEPVSTYYYSTSCGFGSDAGVWREENREEMPYLSASHIAPEGSQEFTHKTPEELTLESSFAAYIRGTGENDYEREEPWYRWNYEVEELSPSEIGERLKTRFNAAKDKVLLYTGDGNPEEDSMGFEPKEPGKVREIYDMKCVKRREGGVMDELLIFTDAGTFKVISEYNIRYILNQGGRVIRQDGSSSQNASLLPSAYMIIEPVKSKKNMIGYTIWGGGYGHGVGMSQNGAKAMGIAGLECQEILSFFYQDCSLEKLY